MRTRIIPARAGFTTNCTEINRPYGDHPRSRGVYYHEIAHETADQGSSPLARGLQIGELKARNYDRIIPARAGFTEPMTFSVSSVEDNPRSRGVYKSCVHLSFTVAGSSPLARGLRRGSGNIIPGNRIIPARAGFTSAPTRSARPRRDHPRSRGVYLMKCLALRAAAGSSPLARGLR